MYNEQLMMALLIASTALAGLKGVFLGQIAKNLQLVNFDKNLPLENVKMLNRTLSYIYILLVSFLFSLVVIITTILWFNFGYNACEEIAYISFLIQIALFAAVFIMFWYWELRQIIRQNLRDKFHFKK